MSLVAIIVIVVVVALALIGLFLLLPRIRERGRVKKRELELRQRRKQAVSEQREEAERRERQAEIAEHRARIAQREAQRERAEAQLRQERAALHERGMADHELIKEHERDKFARHLRGATVRSRRTRRWQGRPSGTTKPPARVPMRKAVRSNPGHRLINYRRSGRARLEPRRAPPPVARQCPVRTTGSWPRCSMAGIVGACQHSDAGAQFSRAGSRQH